MRQTLFHLPEELFGYPLFGVGLLLAAWCLFSLVFLTWQYRRAGWSGEFTNSLVMSALFAGVVWKLLPLLADAEGIPIRGYGVMMLIAVVCSVGLAVHRARRVGLSDEVVYSLAMWMVFPGIFGARLFFVIEYRDQFLHGHVVARLAQKNRRYARRRVGRIAPYWGRCLV
ncbi:MAG: prolipoprotein diacylglyceryl transferase [Pirellulales bacterium]